MTTYRDAAIVFWGDAGAYAYDAYERIREALYPDLPEQLPIVIGLTAYGRCVGLTEGRWEHGPRITLPPEAFQGTTTGDPKRSIPGGRRYVDDVLTHEMLHASLFLAGVDTEHESAAWYEAVRDLSPAVLGHELDARRGAQRKSVREPNPAYAPGNGQPKTRVRKERVTDVIQHADVARWPVPFRPEGYDWGERIPCPAP